MAYKISGDALRQWHRNNTMSAINSPFAKTVGSPFATRGPLLTDADVDNILALNAVGAPGYQDLDYTLGSRSTMLNNMANKVNSGKVNPNSAKNSAFKNAAGSVAGAAADVVGDAAVDTAMSGKGDGLKGFFNNTKANLGTAWGNVKAGKGVMPQYAGVAKGIMGAQAALQAANAFNDYNNAKGNTDDLISDILASAGSNPNLRYDLSTDQLDTLRRLQNGTYDTTGDFDMNSLLGNLGNIATGAGIGFVTGGGVPGAILGGLSGVIDGVSSGVVGNQEQITADLQGLYAALQEAEMRNKAMKRDAAMQRYANSLYY